MSDKSTRFGLTDADLAAIPPDLIERREAFVRRYCAERGWPEDPAELTREQLFEIVEDEEYPR